MAKILLVEDDRQFAGMVAEWLSYEHHLVETVHSGAEGLDRVRIGGYDILILDWGLPDLDGLELLKQFRHLGGTTPIIMLTGKDSFVEKETGLDSGADDYVTKPCNMKELAARVRALLRRAGGSRSNRFQGRDIVLDPVKYSVERGGQPVHLLPGEFALLEFLMRHPGQVFSGDHLLQSVWSTDSEATIEAVRTCIKRLRQKLDQEGGNSVIETVARVGYRFNPD